MVLLPYVMMCHWFAKCEANWGLFPLTGTVLSSQMLPVLKKEEEKKVLLFSLMVSVLWLGRYPPSLSVSSKVTHSSSLQHYERTGKLERWQSPILNSITYYFFFFKASNEPIGTSSCLLVFMKFTCVEVDEGKSDMVKWIKLYSPILLTHFVAT